MARAGAFALPLGRDEKANSPQPEMVFLSNNLEWSPASIADLYWNRWTIEAFFKQTLQLAGFLGHSANAVRWQVWTALLVYVLLRFLAFLRGWAHGFTRLFIVTPQRPFFAGFCALLWDSHIHCTERNPPQKSKSRFRSPPLP
jgi:hypothetical protein